MARSKYYAINVARSALPVLTPELEILALRLNFHRLQICVFIEIPVRFSGPFPKSYVGAKSFGMSEIHRLVKFMLESGA